MRWLSALFQRVRHATYMIQVFFFYFFFCETVFLQAKCKKLHYSKINNQRENDFLFNSRGNKLSENEINRTVNPISPDVRGIGYSHRCHVEHH